MPPVTALTNIGTLYTGDLAAPVADADTLLIVEGAIQRLGGQDLRADADVVLDARGMTVAPGLIDSHCHVVLGDYTPRQQTVGFLASYVHGGITQVVSPGEIHAPGRPRDAAGVKALAVAAQRCWQDYRPGGMKVHGGSVVLEPTLSDGDLAEIAALGVRLAKFGFGRYTDPLDGLPQVRAAQRAGITVMCHSGGASIPGSQPITVAHLLALRPDVCGHLNGGPTSLDDEGLREIVRTTDMVVQLVQAGCLRSSLLLASEALATGAAARVIIGSDTPTGTGVMPLAMLKTIAELCSLGGVDPAVAWCWASGNIGRVYDLGTGVIRPGAPADLCVLDAPWGSRATDVSGALRRGDIPGVSAVLIDGVVHAHPSRNTPAPARQADVPAELMPRVVSAHV